MAANKVSYQPKNNASISNALGIDLTDLPGPLSGG